MRSIVFTHQYKINLKLARRRHLPEAHLNEIIFNLANDIPLSQDKKDHALTGSLSGFRKCHIQPDWLLIYSKEDEGELHILNLIRTGTHSDLFKK